MRYNTWFDRLSLILLIWTFTHSISLAQLAGNYTVNQSIPASSTNYQSMTDILNDLEKGVRFDGYQPAGPGIKSAVVVEVTKGTGPYFEQFRVGSISGSSKTANLTLRGNGEIFIHNKDIDTANFVVLFDHAANVTFEDFQLELHNDSIGNVLQISNLSSFITIVGCKLYQPKALFNVQARSSIMVSDMRNVRSFDSKKIGNPGNNISINGNLVDSSGVGEFYGILVAYERDDLPDQKIYIANNFIHSFAIEGIKIVNVQRPIILHNDISKNNRKQLKYSFYAGITVLYPANSQGVQIDGNHIHSIHPSNEKQTRGIELFKPTMTPNMNGNFEITNNVISLDSNYYKGTFIGIRTSISVGYCDSIRITGNKIKINSEGVSAINIENGTQGTHGSIYVGENDIEVFESYSYSPYGITFSLQFCTLNTPAVLANNIIHTHGTGVNYGFYENGLKKGLIKLLNNTFVASIGTRSTTQYGVIFIKTGAPLEMFNNLFYSDFANSHQLLEYTNSSANLKCDYNCIYMRQADNSKTLVDFVYAKRTYRNWNEFMDSISGGHDVQMYPDFADIRSRDFRPTNWYLYRKGKPLTGIDKDINGRIRDKNFPDIGAYESGDFSAEKELKTIPYQLYPNPCDEVSSLIFDNAKSDAFRFSLYSIQGELVQQNSGITNNRHVINRGNLPAGVYFFTLTNQSNIQITGRLIMQ